MMAKDKYLTPWLWVTYLILETGSPVQSLIINQNILMTPETCTLVKKICPPLELIAIPIFNTGEGEFLNRTEKLRGTENTFA